MVQKDFELIFKMSSITGFSNEMSLCNTYIFGFFVKRLTQIGFTAFKWIELLLHTLVKVDKL